MPGCEAFACEYEQGKRQDQLTVLTENKRISEKVLQILEWTLFPFHTWGKYQGREIFGKKKKKAVHVCVLRISNKGEEQEDGYPKATVC